MAENLNVEAIIRTMLTRAIDEKAHFIREDLIKDAVAKFEHQLRSAVANIAIEYGQFFSIHSHGAETVIHVKVEGGRL